MVPPPAAGRIVTARAAGVRRPGLDAGAVLSFYGATLPALGWRAETPNCACQRAAYRRRWNAGSLCITETQNHRHTGSAKHRNATHKGKRRHTDIR